MSFIKQTRLILEVILRSAFLSLFFLVTLAVSSTSVVFAADIEAVINSSDGSSTFSVQNATNVEQAHIDSIGNVVAKGCVRIDSGLVECSESEGLVVDGNVGIGTVNPLSKLQVAGGLARFGLGGTLDAVSGAGEVYIQNALEVDGNIYASNIGLGTTAVGSGLIVMSGNVGIGTWSPDSPLKVMGIVESAVGGFKFPDGTIQTTSLTAAGWTDGGANVYTITTSDNVGVGTTTPSSTLEVVKTAAGLAPFMVSRVATSDGDLLMIASSGSVGVGTTTPVGGLVVMNGNVGIGTWSPIGSLEVKGGSATRVWTGAGTDTNATAGGELYVEGDLEVDGTIYGDGSGITALPTTLVAGGWVDGGSNVFQANTTDNVGIGTTTPATTLEIVKTSNRAPIMISSAAGNAGDYLLVTSSGNIGVGTNAPRGALTILSGNLGIGTTNPAAELSVGPASEFQVTSTGAIATAGGYTQSGVGANTLTGMTTFTNAVSAVFAGNVGMGTSAPVGALAIMTGNVGIGTWSPNSPLQVNGIVESMSGGFKFPDGTIQTTSLTAAGWTDGGTNVYNTTTSDVVGIGTTTASTTLEIVKQGTSAPVMISSVATSDGDFLKMDSSGNIGVGTTTPVGGVVVMNGNVGVGTWSPIGSLEVRGGSAARVWTGAGTDTNATSGGELYVEGDLEVDGTIYGDGSGITALPATLPAGGWTDGGTNIYPTNTTDNVGIGTTTPGGRLEVVNSGASPPLIVSSSATSSDGDYLTITTSGNVGVGTSFNGAGLSVMNGNVGIGTWNPISKLEVKGEIRGSLFSGDGSGLFNLVAGTNIRDADLDTSIQMEESTDEDYIRMDTAGFERFVIQPDGNVGISTANPASLLAVGATSQFQINSAGAIAAVTGITTSGAYTQTGAGINAFSGNVGLGTIAPRGALTVLSGNVGIGTTDPANALAIGPASQFQVSTTGAITAVTGITTTGGYNQTGSDSNILTGNVGLGTTPVGGLTVMTGNVGIGTWSPIGSLEVKGGAASRIWTGAGTDTNATSAGELYVEGDLEVDGTIYGDGSGITALPTTLPAGGWSDGGTNIYTTTTTDFVGIGTTSPSTTLEVVQQGSNAPFMISGTASSDGNYVIVTSSGNIGVGTVAPRSALTVLSGNVGIGTTNAQAAFAVGGASQFQVTNAGAIAAVTGITTTGGYNQTGSDSNILTGNVGLGTTPVGGLTVMTGNVGIGTWSPVGSLEVRGGTATRIWTGAGTDTNATAAGELYVEGDLEVDGTLYGDGSGLTLTGGLTLVSGWTDGGTNVYTITTTDNVGIGTTTPNAATLEVVKNAAQPLLKLSSAATGAGDFLTVASSGNVGIGTALSSDGTGLSVMNGNVGIGTWSPAAALDVKGGGQFSNGVVINANISNALVVTGGSGAGQSAALLRNNQAGAQVLMVRGAAGQTGDLVQFQDAAGGTLSAVNAAGNLGVGTTAAGSLLTVKGGAGVGSGRAYTTLTAPTDGLMVQGNVAIGTTAAASALTVSGGEAIGSGYVAAAAPANGLLVQGNVGLGTITPVGGLTVMTGNVGIGTWSPIGQLEVRGGSAATRIWTGAGTDTNATAAGELYVEGDLEVDGTIYGDGSGITALPSTLPAGGWTDGGANVYTTTTTDNVGIGTTTPNAATFEVVKNAAQPLFKLSSAAGSAGDLLVVGSDGRVGVGTTLTAPGTALSVMNGNIGIGTWNAVEKLYVNEGNLRIKTSAGMLGINNSGSVSVAIDVGSYNSGSSLSYNIGSSGAAHQFQAGGVNRMVILSSGNVGIGTIAPIGGLSVMAGNVGIGTWSPNNGLEVKGVNAAIISTGGTNTNATSPGELYVQGDLEVDGTIYGDGSGITGPSGITAAGGWTDGGTNVYTSTTTDNVGIGTTTPSTATTLEIVKNGASQAPLKISSTASGAGDFFNVASAGNVGIGTNITSAGTALSIMNGNVGIGTWSPIGRLHVITNAASPLYVANDDNSANDLAQFYAQNLTLGVGINYQGIRQIATNQHLYVNANGTGNVAINGSGGTGNLIVGGGPATVGSKLTVFGNAIIGTGYYAVTAPANGLAVEGNVGIGTTAANGALIIANGNVGVGTLNPVAGLAVMTGNVGVGTWSPIGALQVRGAGPVVIDSTGGTNTNATAAGELYVQGDLEVDGTIYGDGSGITGGTVVNAGGWTDGGVNVYTSTTTDNVGIGTTTPNAATLEVVKNAAQPLLKLSSAAGTAGDFVIVTSSGNVGIGTTTPFGGLVVMDGNTGLGTIGPGSKLSVAGGAAVGSGSAYTSLAAPTNGLIVQGNVGMGTTAAASALTVSGGETIGSGLVAVTAPTNGLLVQGNVGLGTTAPVGGLIVMNGNVGIGTWSPTATLQVGGSVTAAIFNGDGSGLVNLAAGASIRDTDNNTKVQTEKVANEDYVRIDTAGFERFTVQPNGNVGVGTANPATLFSVGSTSQFQVTATGAITAVTGITTTGGYAQTGTGTNILSGNVGLGTTPVGALTVMTGNVGIGTWSPNNGLEVKGVNAAVISTGGTNTNATSPGELYVQGDLEVDGTIYGDGSGITALASTLPAGGWTDGGTNVYTTATTDNVGIGTTTPNAATVEIVKNAAQPLLKLSSVATGSGDMMIINSVGSVGIGTTLSPPTAKLAVFGGNVGIGTWSPASALQVQGATQLNNAANGSLSVREVDSSTTAYGNTAALTLQNTNSTTNNWTEIDFSGNGGIAGGVALQNTNHAGAQGDIAIFARGSTGFGERLRVTGDGNVGVGTTTPVGGLTVMSGNVGIGTWSPSSTFELKQGNASIISTGGTNTNATGPGELYVQGDLEVDGTIYGDGSGLTGTSQLTTAGGWTDGGANVYLSLTTDNVGIGTTTPATTLEIVKTANRPPLMVSSVVTGGGDYMIIRSSGNVGIGTVLPTATLTINGILSLEPSATANITAVGGISATRSTMRVQGNGGPVIITANPQIAAGADGEILVLQGMSNANTVQIQNGNGIRLQGGVAFTLGLGDSITMSYDSSSGNWTEISRTDN